MKVNKLKHFYLEQLLKQGVDKQKAEEASESLTQAELKLIGEIWSDWGLILKQLQLK